MMSRWQKLKIVPIVHRAMSSLANPTATPSLEGEERQCITATLLANSFLLSVKIAIYNTNSKFVKWAKMMYNTWCQSSFTISYDSHHIFKNLTRFYAPKDINVI